LFRSERSIDDENHAVWLLDIFSYLCTCNLFIYKLVVKVVITNQVSCEYVTRCVIRIATAGALPIVIFFLGVRFWNFFVFIPIRRCDWDHSTVRSRFHVEFRLRSLTVFVCVFIYHGVTCKAILLQYSDEVCYFWDAIFSQEQPRVIKTTTKN